MQNITKKRLAVLAVIIIALVGGIFAFQIVASDNDKTDQQVKGEQTTIKKVIGIEIAGKNPKIYTYEFEKEQTLETALIELDNTRDDFSFQYERFDFGILITSINDNQANDSQFWKLVINNQDSQVGVSDYQIQDTDEIKFELDEINF